MKELEQKKSEPVAILISDIHYNLKNLELADAAMRMAVAEAHKLKVPLIVAGDLHDSKANLRSECISAIIKTLTGESKMVYYGPWILIGNHDLDNENGQCNALEFLKPYAELIKSPCRIRDFYFIPYQSSAENFEMTLAEIPKGSIVICHQGVTGADMGEYVHDKSAVSKDILADYRVISGHYHRAQNIKCGPPRKGAVGLMSYIGSPYTVTFSEAHDGPKGFQILLSDGTLEQVPTNLKKHVIIDCTYDGTTLFRQSALEDKGHTKAPTEAPGDLIWVKVTGTRLNLNKLSKHDVANSLSLYDNNFKLDTIPIDAPKSNVEINKKTHNEIMGLLIDDSDESPESKDDLKKLYKELMS